MSAVTYDPVECAPKMREVIHYALGGDYWAKKTWIYFVRVGDAVKIGRAKDLGARLRLLRVDNADEVQLLAKIRGTVAGEKEIQDLFHKSRIRGEWFRETPELIEFATYCAMVDLRDELQREAGLL